MQFNDNAFDRLSKTAPDVLPFITSFVDLTADIPESYGIELGVFIINTSGTFFYIPVISKGGTIYPIDSVFSAVDSQFFPLTAKLIEKILNSNEMSMGTATTIPASVVRNPSIRELIEPPKTGKYMYAGSIGDLLAQLPEVSKEVFLNKLATDISMTRDLRDLGFDIPDMVEALKTRMEKVASVPVSVGAKVVTGGEGLPQEVITQIMERGYGLMGFNPMPTFTFQYDARNDGYTNLQNGEPGKVYEVIMKNGSSKVGFIPPRMKKIQVSVLDHTEPLATYSINQTSVWTRGKLPIIFEDGTYCDVKNPVIRATTLGNIEEVLYSLADKGLIQAPSEISMGTTIMLITSSAWVGPLHVKMVTRSPDVGVTITCFDPAERDHNLNIHISDNVHGDFAAVGHNIYCNLSAAFLVLPGYCLDDVETDVFAASRNRAMQFDNNLALVKVAFDGVEFAVNHKAVGSEIDLAREMLENLGIEKQAFEAILHKAKTENKVEFFMSKSATFSDQFLKQGAFSDPGGYMDMPSGDMPPAESNVLPQKGDNNAGPSFDTVNQAIGTGDKSIVESTIIAEFINDPNMFETIGTYLPTIKESIDKIGRAIFLIRLNVNNLSESIEPEYLSNLMTSLRNTYKMLGDSYMKLESISNVPPQEENEV